MKNEKHFNHNNQHKNADGILFHKDVYLPEGIIADCKNILSEMETAEINFTDHMVEILEKQSDGASRKFDYDDVWNSIDFVADRAKGTKFLDIFEIGVREDSYKRGNEKDVCKIGFRSPLDMDRDICVFVGYNNKKFNVITAYVNFKDDEHAEGFDKKRYIQGKKK